MPPSRRRPARPAPLDSAEPRPSAGGGLAGDRAAAARGSFGQWLRGQREARNVELAEIAEASKISLRYLDALEHDRFEVLPAPVFVRGFLREYARVVGLDPDEVVNLFLVSAPRLTPERKPESSGSSYSSQQYSDSGGSSYGRALLIGLATLLILGIAAGLSYWATRKPGATPAASSGFAPPESSPPPAASQPAAAPSAPQELSGDGAEPSPSGESVAPGPTGIATVVPAAPSPTTASPPAVSAAAAVPPAAPHALVVVLAFQQDCWVEARVDGGRRSSELRAGGETLTLEANDSIVLTLGNAPAVRAELNGRPLSLPADASRLLREFRIDRTLIAPPASPEAAHPSGP